MEASPRFFVNGWKQGIWDDFLDLHTSTATKGNSSKEYELDATAMFVYLFISLYHQTLEGKANEDKLQHWKVFIKDNHDKVIKPVVESILDKLGLVRACRAFGAVLIDKYDIKTISFPLKIDNLDRKYEDKIIDALQDKSTNKNYMKFFWLSPWDNILCLPKLIKL